MSPERDKASSELRRVVVIGAGVIGLTTAVRIQETGRYDVTVLAEKLPSDEKSIDYASHWAGAHHVGFPGDTARQQKLEQETFDTLVALCEANSTQDVPTECFLRIPQVELYASECPPGSHTLSWMPDFKFQPRDTLPEGVAYGVSFTTLTVDPTFYLPYLHERFLKAGGTVVRGRVQRLSQLAKDGVPWASMSGQKWPPEGIVCCVGLGALTLGDVEDASMFPVRGQTVILKAPWIRFGRTLDADGNRTYVIPRASGDLVVGGTREANVWHATPRSETTYDILRRALVLCPELAPSAERSDEEDLEQNLRKLLPLIAEEGCGLRPARHGGIRLEAENVGKVAVVYNYGHGGGGYQSSWGSANVAFQLLDKALQGGEGVIALS